MKTLNLLTISLLTCLAMINIAQAQTDAGPAATDGAPSSQPASQPSSQPASQPTSEPVEKENFKVTGKITDAKTGKALSGVTVKETKTKTTAVTDESGIYSFSLPAGGYQLTVETSGYSKFNRKQFYKLGS